MDSVKPSQLSEIETKIKTKACFHLFTECIKSPPMIDIGGDPLGSVLAPADAKYCKRQLDDCLNELLMKKQ